MIVLLAYQNYGFSIKNITKLCFSTIMLVFIIIISGRSNLFAYNIKVLFVTFAVFALRKWADKYNYKVIKISELKSGMILTVDSTLLLINAGVKEIPLRFSEDMSGRLTPSEIQAIQEWAYAHNTCDEIAIVQKIPFAAFISLGYSIIIGGYCIWLNT